MEYEKPHLISKYIEGFGNYKRNVCFLAVRFKKKIVWVSKLKQNCTEIEDMFILSNTLRLKDDDSSVEMTVSRQDYNLLATMLGAHEILYKVLHHGILFVLMRGPLPKWCVSLRRTAAFRALYELSQSYMQQTPLMVGTCSLVRHFRRNCRSWPTWSLWYRFAVTIATNSFKTTTGSVPTRSVAHLLYKILRESQKPISYLPQVPPDFYTCEIFLDDSALVGICFLDDYSYVSPMVVSQQPPFRDVNQRQCNRWLPFFRNQYTWCQKGGLAFYVAHLHQNRQHVKRLIPRLARHSSDKFRYMLQDLKIVRRLLFVK